MKKLSTSKEKLVWMFNRIGVQVPALQLVDAVYDIEREMSRSSVSFEVALWRWWQQHMQGGYALIPQSCQRELCNNEFVCWDKRSRKYCSDRCKQAAENARWYQHHAARRKVQVTMWRNWSKGRTTPAPELTSEIRVQISDAIKLFGYGVCDENDIQRVWGWMLAQGVSAEDAMAELCGF